MSDPIDLNAERNKRALPDSEFVTTDEYGRKFYKFAIDYHFAGQDYGLHIWAENMEEAMKRTQAIRSSAVLIGQLMGSAKA